MKSISRLLATLAVMIFSTSGSWAEGMPEFPKPSPEHAWLQQLVGEWDAETEAYMAPDQPPVKLKGTESIRSVGGFWTVSEIKSTMLDQPFTGNLTLGYDTDKKEYVGTWVDSMTGRLWNYQGKLDAAANTLTLETEGACPLSPGKVTKFREVIELKSPDHKVFSSFMLGEDGQWIPTMTSHSQRKP